MKHALDSMNWRTRVEEAEDNYAIWWRTHTDILMELIDQLQATNMKNVVIPPLTKPKARNLFESFNEELERWKDDVKNGVEKDDWSNLLEYRAFIFDYQISHLIITVVSKR